MKYDHEPLLDSYSYQLKALSYRQICDSIRDRLHIAFRKGLNASDEENLLIQNFETIINKQADSLNEAFKEEYEELTEGKQYFYGCRFEIYKNTYGQRLDNFLKTFSDGSEIGFILYELEKGIFKNDYEIKGIVKQNMDYSLGDRFLFLQEKGKTLGYEIEYSEEGVTTGNAEGKRKVVTGNNETYFITMIDNSGNIAKPITPKGVSSTISQTEIVELVYSLIHAGKVEGTIKDTIEQFSQFLGTEVNNPSKLFQDIKRRNNGSEALFLDSLGDVIRKKARE